MAIIITDIHGDPAAARAFLAHKPKEQHICLGDLTDSRKHIGLEAETECLELILASDTILLWGNHDLAYLPEHPWKCFGSFGDLAFREQFQTARHRFHAAYAVDGWLCTHAGISPQLARYIPEEVLAANVEAIAEWLNKEFVQELSVLSQGNVKGGRGPLFSVPVCRGGVDEYGGIFWFDAEGEQTCPTAAVGRQIFGHSPVPTPERGQGWNLNEREPVPWINLNSFDGHWIYDTTVNELLELKT